MGWGAAEAVITKLGVEDRICALMRAEGKQALCGAQRGDAWLKQSFDFVGFFDLDDAIGIVKDKE